MKENIMVRNSLTEKEMKMLQGENLKPITRREMYIRALYNPKQEVPKPITKEDRSFCIAIAKLRENK